jgi:hypothetical protein
MLEEQEQEQEQINQEKKQIHVQGKTNRYWIKKMVRPRDAAPNPKKRQGSLALDPTAFSLASQKQWLSLLSTHSFSESSSHHYPILLENISRKISGYLQQDRLRKREGRLTTQETILLLEASDLQCFYCRDPLYLLYEHEREKKQWTLDRIDNDQGHTATNVVISCLECNLKKKRRSKDAFVFTQQLQIVQQDK